MHVVYMGNNLTYPDDKLLNSLTYKTDNPMRRCAVDLPRERRSR